MKRARGELKSLRIATGRLAGLRIVAAVALAALVFAAGCNHDEAVAPPPLPEVTVAQAVTESVADYIDFTGNTAAIDSVNLVARVEGYLEQIHFTDGALVKKNDLLFTIQQDQYKAQLLQAEAQVATAKAALWHAKTELARYSGLYVKGAASATEVDHWRYERDSSAAQLSSAEAQVVIDKLNLSYTEVRAPFDGRIGRHLVDPGNLVGSAGQQTVLAEINRIDPIYVYFTVNENDLLRIVNEQPEAARRPLQDQEVVPAYYGLINEEGFPHAGRLDFASISVAPTTGTLQVRGIFPNPIGAVPGLFVRVRVPALQKREALLIPGDAVSFDQQGEYVLVVDDKNVVERRSVKTGLQIGDNLVIEDGLAATDWVIVEGLMQAIPGREVSPQRAPAGKFTIAEPSAGG